MPLDPVPNITPIVEDKKTNFIWATWFFNLHQRVTRSGLYVDLTAITTSESPYSMMGSDEVIVADPDAGAITVNLIPGENGRLIRIKNVKTGASANVSMSPASGDDIQVTVGSDPGAGPYTLTKGQDVTFVYIESETAWYIFSEVK